MKFSIKNFFSKCDQETVNLEILYGKLHFLCCWLRVGGGGGGMPWIQGEFWCFPLNPLTNLWKYQSLNTQCLYEIQTLYLSGIHYKCSASWFQNILDASTGKKNKTILLPNIMMKGQSPIKLKTATVIQQQDWEMLVPNRCKLQKLWGYLIT